ncbi:hypothetical protein ACQP1G_35155 [Nocardia sp. CA-107356]|uniref:hypothetical protein n=1 Tax=Nocardia sp. CA-107356 TaxID=3239972 RepID=UPI003D948198
MHASMQNRLKELDGKAERLLDIAADGQLPQDKIKTRLHRIRNDWATVEANLAATGAESAVGVEVLMSVLELIADPPQRLQRRRHPAALERDVYECFYLDIHGVTSDRLNQPFADLHDAAGRGGRGSTRTTQRPIRSEARNGKVVLPGPWSQRNPGRVRPPLVGDLRRQSNCNGAGQGLLALLAEAGHEANQPRSRDLTSASPRRLRQLNEQERAALALDCTSGGLTVYELATKYGISRDTVGKHLHRMGVEMRRAGLSEEQIDEAVRLYDEGWSAQRIGDKLDVYPQTVRRRLLGRGERMRDTHGRKR